MLVTLNIIIRIKSSRRSLYLMINYKAKFPVFFPRLSLFHPLLNDCQSIRKKFCFVSVMNGFRARTPRKPGERERKLSWEIHMLTVASNESSFAVFFSTKFSRSAKCLQIENYGVDAQLVWVSRMWNNTGARNDLYDNQGKYFVFSGSFWWKLNKM